MMHIGWINFVKKRGLQIRETYLQRHTVKGLPTLEIYLHRHTAKEHQIQEICLQRHIKNELPIHGICLQRRMEKELRTQEICLLQHTHRRDHRVLEIYLLQHTVKGHQTLGICLHQCTAIIHRNELLVHETCLHQLTETITLNGEISGERTQELSSNLFMVDYENEHQVQETSFLQSMDMKNGTGMIGMDHSTMKIGITRGL